MTMSSGGRGHVSKALLRSCVLSVLIIFIAHGVWGETGNAFLITSHRASLQIYSESNAISCIDTITVRPLDKRARKLSLGFIQVYKIDYLYVNGSRASFRQHGDSLAITDVPTDKEFTIIISYFGTLSFESDFAGISPTQAVLFENAVLPSNSEKLDYVRLAITVAKTWQAVAAGRLTRTISSGDSTTFVWESKEQLPSLGWICAGEYDVNHDSAGSPPISIYRMTDDSTKTTQLAETIRKILTFYSKIYVPYRFPKLDIVEVEDWVGGRNVLAIASPSVILVKRMAFETTDKFNRVENVLPHELAHQWWPLTIYAADEDAALLSEGMCEYSARLYHESAGGLGVRDSLVHHPLLRPLLVAAMEGRDVPMRGKVDLRTIQTHYLKGSYVHHMLRNIIGDAAYMNLLHRFAGEYREKETNADLFEKVAEEVSGDSLSWFFDQWTEKKAIPHLKVYAAHASEDSSGWITRGRVRVIRYDKFTTYADVAVETPADTPVSRVWLGYANALTKTDSTDEYHNDVPFAIHSKGKPATVTLDPGGNTLKLQNLPARFSDLRSAGSGLMIVGSLLHADHLLGLARKDSAAMTRYGWTITIKTDSEITLQDLQQPTVILYGTRGENSRVEQVEKKFPYGFRHDSVEIRGEVLFDSSLALMQAIENPYLSHGFLGWVAPLSVKAFPELFPFDASWVLQRGKEQISSGVFDLEDEDISVRVKF